MRIAKLSRSLRLSESLASRIPITVSCSFRSVDYRLTSNEFDVLRTNGFVASERLGARSFGDAFYNLWHNDLPVFVSCDPWRAGFLLNQQPLIASANNRLSAPIPRQGLGR